MSITETPKVKFRYVDTNPLLNGNGAQIPVFIGYSGNASPNTGLLKFRNYNNASKAVNLGGLGSASDDNVLLATIKDFFTEVRKTEVDDITVPFVYAIDLGAVPTKTVDEETVRDIGAEAWLNAIALAKTALEAQVEVYCGFTTGDEIAKVTSIMDSAISKEVDDSEKGNPRDLYLTIHDATDEQLKNYTDDTQNNYISSSCVGLCQPDDFGKIIARICCTPATEEPGYYEFRTIENGVYNKRTDEECDELQNAGIIFIKDEMASSVVVTRINLTVSTAFAATTQPNDALFHARRNVNQLVREIYPVLFKQIKRNETETYISMVQTDVNVIVKSKIKEGTLMKGSVVNVEESNKDPYTLSVDGNAIPVNCTGAIQFTMYIEKPNAIGGE